MIDIDQYYGQVVVGTSRSFDLLLQCVINLSTICHASYKIDPGILKVSGRNLVRFLSKVRDYPRKHQAGNGCDKVLNDDKTGPTNR